MAKRQVHLKFAIGNKIVTIEDGSGYADQSEDPMYDSVNVAIRAKSASGAPGAIDERSLHVRREQILAIGLNFVHFASQMMPRTLWARSESVESAHKEPTIFHLLEEEQKALESFSKEDLKQIHADAREKYENLQRRMHILQRCQRLLEILPEAPAQQLDLLLTFLEGAGEFPFGLGVVPISPEEDTDLIVDGKTRH